MKKLFPAVKWSKIAAVALSLCLAASLCCLSGCSMLKKGSSGSFGDLKKFFSANVVREKNVVLPEENKAEANVTVLVYMNGSDLESDYGEATRDLGEMVAAGATDYVNVVVQTMGTSKWQKYGISSKHTQRYEVDGNGLTLVDDSLGQLDTTEAKTLQDFVTWGATNYPADRYILLFWNHGGGPVFGFGQDQIAGEEKCLTIDEIQQALKGAGVFFDFIGMDCCIMSSLEVCMALYDFCDYTILSEDFESGLGWSYTGWLRALNQNPAIPTPELGTIIIDDMVNDNVNNRLEGSDSILTLIDQSVMKVLYTAWIDFAYENEDALLNANYTQQLELPENGRPLNAAARGNGWSWVSDMADWVFSTYDDSVTLDAYYITDIMAVAQNVDSEKSKALGAALDQAIVYTNSTQSDSYLSGLSVTLPYGDYYFYQDLKRVFTNCGFDAKYIDWLGNFVTAKGYSDFYDYSDYNDEWEGWDEYDSVFDWSKWEFFNDDEYWNDFEENDNWDNWDYDNSWNSFLDDLLSDDGADDWDDWDEWDEWDEWDAGELYNDFKRWLWED